MQLVRQFLSKDCITALTWAPSKIKKNQKETKNKVDSEKQRN